MAVTAASRGMLLNHVRYTAMERPDVSEGLALPAGTAAGFALVVEKCGGLRIPEIRVLAAMPSGTAAELPGVHQEMTTP
jgi:hypothetical protein